MSSPAKSDATRDDIEKVWNHVYARRYPKKGNGPRQVIKDNPEAAYDPLETAYGSLWDFAKEHGLDDVLASEDAPKPTEVSSRYDALVDADGDLDDNVLSEAMEDLDGLHTLIDDLASGW